MTAHIALRPGLTPLIDWRDVYRGVPLTLDPYARPDVEAGVAALAEIADSTDPLPRNPPSVADLMEADGELLPAPLVRLFVALKLASLGQGMSGVRWDTLTGIDEFLSAGLLPAIPGEAATDRVALACLFAAFTGTGRIVRHGKSGSAATALRDAKLRPHQLTAWERQALVTGSHLTTATALAGLFETERVFQSALVIAALSAAALTRSNVPLNPSAPQLHRQPGQVDVAVAWRALLEPAEPIEPVSHDASDPPLRDEPLRLGACLDLLRQAGATLERAASVVSEDRVVLWQSGEIVAGTTDSSATTRAADVVALALTSLADLSLTRTAALSASDADAAGAAPHGGVHVSPHTQAAGFASRLRDYREAGLGPRRLLPMAGMAALVLAVECLQAARLRPHELPTPLSLAHTLRLIRDRGASANGADLSSPGALALIAERIRSGALADAIDTALPGVAADTPRRG